MGENPSGENNSYRTPPVQHIRPHHKAMARMMVAGATPGEVATALGFSAGHMSHIQASPAFQAILAQLEEDADDSASDLAKQMEAMKMRALEVLDEDLDIEVQSLAHRRVRQRAAVDILDRTIGKKDNSTPPSGGPTLHFHNHKELQLHVRSQSTEELAQNVLDLVIEDD